MRTTMDEAGRLTLPEELQRRAGLRPGMSVEVRWRDGQIEITPLPLAITLRQEGRFLVAVPEDGVEPLTAEIVEETRRALLQERNDAGL